MAHSPSAGSLAGSFTFDQGRDYSHRVRGLLAVVVGLAMIASMALTGALTAHADTAPPNAADPKTPVTVSADALPTVQINGVVWNQAIIGTTAYAVGKFTTARPAGAAPNTQTVTRNNILAYDIRTGVLINSFAPSLNAQAYAVTASPDGSRLYIGGDFTSISGRQVWRVAALDPSTGAVITSFLPRMGASVRALTASNSTVYMGGLFPNVGSVSRNRLAAMRASDGGLLSWAPNANQRVNAMVLSPDNSQVVIGGVFTTLNGSNRPGYGLGRVDATTGANLSLDANNVVRDAGPQSAILSLSSDGTNFYGTGYIYGTGGNLEGAFSANWSDGKIRWVQDCHGDSYGAWASSTAVYVAGHAHYCQNIGGFPETSPRSYHRGLAFSKAATGVMTKDTQGYPSFTGVASPSLLNWYPDLDTGTVTGQNQGPWGVTGTEQYVLMGGEFRNVNGKAQQGLVRFAVSSIAPNKEGPRGTITPTASYLSPGTVRINWGTYWDRDNTNLNYSVVRDGNTASPVFQGNQTSVFWQRPNMTFTDSGVSAGTHNYRIVTKDPFNNSVTSATVSVNVPVGGAGNSPPTAQFTVSANARQISVDASASTDAGGSISNYAWNFGDSTTGSGRQTTHTYPADGTYQVVLTVTDNDGATATTSRSVQVSGAVDPPPPPPVGGAVAQDNFGRTVANGLGSADVGGAWSLNGSASGFAVNGGSGDIITTRAGSGPGAYLNSVSSSSTDTLVQFAMDKIANGGGSYVYVAGRSVPGAGDYRAKVRVASDGTLTLYSTAVVGGTVTTLRTANITGFKVAANQAVMVRLQVVGTSPTTVQAKLWRASEAEPSGWQVTGTDSRSTLQAAGSVGLLTYVSGATTNVPITMRFDNLQVTVPGGAPNPPANVAPVAAFTSSSVGLTASLNGSSSTDSDGTIAAYAWNFGDGTAAGSGATTTHSYAAAGSYQVVLTVTDNDGATASTTRTVQVSSPDDPPPPVGGALVQDNFGRTVANGLGSADVGGAWSLNGSASGFAVNGGSGAIITTRAGSGPGAYLTQVSSSSTDTSVQFSMDKIANGGGSYVYVAGRSVPGAGDYRAKVRVASDGTLTLYSTAVVGGTVTTLRTANIGGFKLVANQAVMIRLQVVGTSPTTVQAKLWRASEAEPAGWQVTSTDSRSTLQAPGSVGLLTYVSGATTNVPITMRFDNLLVNSGG